MPDPAQPHETHGAVAPPAPSSDDVGRMFDRAADRYDLLNTLLSWGRDGSWRRTMADFVHPAERVLDLCCGTARSVVPVARRSGREVVGVDVSGVMLAEGRHHARQMRVQLAPVRADALQLPFQDGTFDAVTIAWGLRNLRPEADALAEIRRVLRPGGTLIVLESPTPEPGLAGLAHRLYLRVAVPALGLLSSDRDAYRYLSRTVLSYGTRQEVSQRLQRADLRVRLVRPLFLGAAALWVCERSTRGPGGMARETPGETSSQNRAESAHAVQDAMDARSSVAGTRSR